MNFEPADFDRNVYGGFSDFDSHIGGGDAFATDGGGFLDEDANGLPGMSSRMVQNRDCVFPMNIHLIQRHLREDPDRDFHVNGQRMEHLKLVGMVRNLTISEGDHQSRWNFDLDDSTGVISVGWVASASAGGVEPSRWWRETYTKSIVNGRYVTVHAIVNSFQLEETPVQALYVIPVEIPEEVFVHQLSVAELLLDLDSAFGPPPSALTATSRGPMPHRPSDAHPPRRPPLAAAAPQISHSSYGGGGHPYRGGGNDSRNWDASGGGAGLDGQSASRYSDYSSNKPASPSGGFYFD